MADLDLSSVKSALAKQPEPDAKARAQQRKASDQAFDCAARRVRAELEKGAAPK